jgi:hypothetical protein
VPVHEYGARDTKSVADLWRECGAGETRLRVEGRTVLREVDVVVVCIRNELGQV